LSIIEKITDELKELKYDACVSIWKNIL
jgi:hypothetical protein